jgi:phosphorylase kinase alpha/beta subunit
MSRVRLPPRPGVDAPAARHAALASCLRDAYAPDDVARVRRQLEALGLTTLPALPNGLYAANPAPRDEVAYTGYGCTWVRDTVQVAAVAWDLGDVPSVARTCASLVAFYELQAPRFEAALAGTSDLDDPMQRPHIRFDGRALAERDEPWPHIQNDAHGYALWLMARAALSGMLPLDDRTVTVLARFPRYFAAIAYERDRDSGHWEEQRRLSCASIGAVVAGLTALRGLCRARERKQPGSAATLAGGQDLDALIARGRAVLDASLPWETRDPAAPERDRRADAALLFLIHPLRVVDGGQATAILDTVREELVGAFGVKRYVGDSYWCADYATSFDEETRTSGFFENVDARDAHLKPGSEAQWCLFDPLLSVIWGWRWLASRDDAQRALQVAHFNRALSQVTGPECRLGPGLCAESYYVPDSSRPDEREVNDATPLLWTQALLLGALEAMERTALAIEAAT